MKQPRVAVFDFDDAGRREVVETLRGYYARDDTPARVVEYGDIPALAYGFRDEPFDMLFAVIRGMMGVEAARIIREADQGLPIFLISETGEYALEGYRIHALHYLLWPVTAEGVAEAVGKVGLGCLMGWADRQA